MANDTGLLDSGEAAQQPSQPEPAADTQPSEPQDAATAPEGTPEAEQEAGKTAEQLAVLEKRIRDTEDALKDKQRELHETTGALKEARDLAARNLGGSPDPAQAQKQREDFLQRVDANPRAAVEWFENVIAGQHQYIEQVKTEVDTKLAQLREESDPLVQRNRDVVEKLMTDPDFKGLSRAQVARLAEKFRTPAASPAQRPPPATAGTQRVVKPAQPQSPLSPEMAQWVRSRASNKQDTSLF